MRRSVRDLRLALLLALAGVSCTRSDSASDNNRGSNAELTAASLGPPPVAPAPGEFAGAEACQSCHAEQFSAWRTSTHGTAGGAPGTGANAGDRVRVIAPFNGTLIRFRDATVIPRQQAGVFAFVVQRPGERDTALVVDAVIGGGHMVGGGTQGFVTSTGDGTLRFLPFDWSRQNHRWFCMARVAMNSPFGPMRLSMASAGFSISRCTVSINSYMNGSNIRIIP